MPEYRMTIVFEGVELDDEDTFDALLDLDDVQWSQRDGLAYASVRVKSPSPLIAALGMVSIVQARVPSAEAIRLDEDLVSVSDVAARIGVTTQAVRNWVSGVRRQGPRFPAPRGVVGDAIKVWAWADVNTWLKTNLNVGDPEAFPTATEVAEINYHLAAERRAHVSASHEWNVVVRRQFGAKSVVSKERRVGVARSGRHFVASHHTEPRRLVLAG